MAELESGYLKPGVTHSENFWKENAKNLEHDKFIYLKKLVTLLTTEHEETLKLALYDIGEFARYYGYGKAICD